MLRCDVCGTPLMKGNIGFIRNPADPDEEFIARCNGCHQSKRRRRRSVWG